MLRHAPSHCPCSRNLHTLAPWGALGCTSSGMMRIHDYAMVGERHRGTQSLPLVTAAHRICRSHLADTCLKSL
eukprot:1494515-Amphidinium_carterae.1